MPDLRALESAQRQPLRGLRRRLLFLGPLLALGLVLLMLWGFVAWFALVYPREQLEEERLDLALTARAAALQTEGVLRDAENSLRAVDLWLLTRRQQDPLADVSLSQLAEALRDTSRHLVDVMLVSRQGEVFRIPSVGGMAHASVAKESFFDELSEPGTEGLVLGLPLRLRAEGSLKLPVAMRLSAPAGDLVIAMALVDVRRLSELHANYNHSPGSAVAVLRGDGRGLIRTPELPGFVGRDVFAEAPQRRLAFVGKSGFFNTDGSRTDGVKRLGAFQVLDGFGAKLLISHGEDALQQSHWRHLRLAILLSALISVVALLASIRLTWLQRAMHMNDAALRATSDASPIGLFRCDLQGRITYANEPYLRMHGLREDQMPWGWLGLTPEAQRETARAEHLQQANSRVPLQFFREVYCGDGRRRLMSVRTAPLLLNGRVIGQAGTVEDITERAAQQQAQRTLASILDLTPSYVSQADAKGRLFYLNPAARRDLGLTPDADPGDVDYDKLLAPAAAAHFRETIVPGALRDGYWHGRSALLRPDGSETPVELTMLVHRDEQGQVETVSTILRDISEELQAYRERLRSEAMLLAIAQTATAMLMAVDREQRYLFFNEAYGRQYQARREDWIGRPMRELVGEADYAASRPLIEAALAGERGHAERNRENAAGRHQVLVEEFAPLLPAGGQVEGVICIAQDVTDARHEESRLRQASQTDPLTQLLNRSGFALGADEELAQARQNNQLLALLYLDLDRFKPVNDQYGHPVGDALLKAVAGRLRHTLRPNDLVARLGGDEFAVLLPGLAHEGDAEVVAAKLVQALSTPFMIDQHQLQIGVSIGFCIAPGGAADMDTLVEQADAKLYEAKRAGRGRQLGTVLKKI